MTAPDAPRDGAPDAGAPDAGAPDADDLRHPERALAADHAVGLLDGAERAAFEAHLAGCAECRAEARAYAETAALLARALPRAEPPPALRARILAEARRPRLVPDAPPAADAAPVRAAPAGVVPFARPARARGGRLPWLAAAASLVLAAGLGAGWARERDARQALERQASAAGADSARWRAERTALLAQVAERDSAVGALGALVDALGEPDVRVARLTRTGEPEAMRLTWNRRRGLVAVVGTGLAVPQPGRVYQLWGIRRGARPQSLGLFRPGRDGTVRAVLRVPPAAAMDLAAVTVEPEGGSPQPTETPRMAGAIAAE